jgi:transposase
MPDAAERSVMGRLWERVRPLPPPQPSPPRGGRPFADDPACLGGIACPPRNGSRWRQMPDGDPSGVA